MSWRFSQCFLLSFNFCRIYTLAIKQIVFTSGFTLWGMRAPGVNITSAERWHFLHDDCSLKTQPGYKLGDFPCMQMWWCPLPCACAMFQGQFLRTQDQSKHLFLRQLDWRPERSLVIQGCLKWTLIASRPREISVLLPELSVKEGEEQASTFLCD